MRVPGKLAEVNLTPTEREVCNLLLNGMTEVQIAKFVGRSAFGMRNTCKRIREKTGCADKLEVALWYLRTLRGDK
jgi:DNA-binding CsgD family transcriptional regulator